MPTITALPTASIHQITSNQVVTSLETAVKELVENSLDAGAGSIEVKFKNYGIKSVEVIDNGSGVAEDDWESIGLKHHTSKLSSFDELSTVSSFGFRGEAVSSLCAMCESVTVTTRADDPIGVILDLDKTGKIKSKKRAARQRGTTITLLNLFAPLPVRRKEFERNAKREYGKALSLLQAYALVPCAKQNGVRLLVSNQIDKGQKSTPIQTQGLPSLRASVIALWGSKSLDGVQDLDVSYSIPRVQIRRHGKTKETDSRTSEVEVHIRGLISAPGCGRSSTDRQFLYVNGRPCGLAKMQKTINEVYRSFTPNHNTASQAPFVVADFEIPTDTYDVNVTPDKRTLFLHNEVAILEGLKSKLQTFFTSGSSTYEVGSSQQIRSNTGSLAQRGNSQRHESIAEMQGLLSTKKRGRTISLEDTEIERRRTRSRTVTSEQGFSPDVGISETTSSVLSSSSHSQPPTFSAMNEMNADSEVECQSILSLTDVETSPSGCPSSVSRPSSTEIAPPQRIILDVEPSSAPSSKSVPYLAVPSVTSRKGQDKEVVINTLFASWARGAGKISENTDDQPGSVKSVPSASLTTDQNKLKTKAVEAKKEEEKKSKQAMLTFRSMLVGFARSGSVVTQATEEVEEDAVDDSEDNVKATDAGQGDEGDVTPIARVKDIGETTNDIMTTSDSQAIDLVSDDEDIAPMEVMTPSSSQESRPISRPEVVRTSQDGEGDMGLRFDLSGVAERWKAASNCSRDSISSLTKKGEFDNNDEAALSRVISKSDFSEMDIVGQFNLGFIVTRRRKGEDGMDDLFIVDQHAADEKYNFETLQETTKIRSQKLFRPQPLELTAADELLALEHLDILKQNGFEVEGGDQYENVEDVGGDSKLRLIAQPVSKSTVFNMKDLEELIHLMHDRPSGTMVRCSKARAIFAMRACRKSVMVGMPLTKGQMTTIIHHMGTMDQPWNCPHGRPTMRHLCDLAPNVHEQARRDSGRKINWSTLVP
ncbi:uncharacterized protein EV420DRAFT_1511385 [Desarmillaria tabescens]|uniref:DNA mismatch repair protein PMS1 n=1 Tax=Armillaria tabescens TaxID=1929756 RepID=A0AA39T5S3_ARMTA|nr:uncharacterized protein EV420DRAFT_1511385 [Desarmillaria tabescens]KAK0466391.1 hypothetical protein EV420DRAFT_1511385 [Desarmillaria tabescens]